MLDSDINEIKEDLRYVENEIAGIKRDLAEIKNQSPIEEAKMLPIGTFLLFLGSLFAFGAYWLIDNQFSGFLFAFNTLSAIVTFYFGIIITRLGLKFKRINKRTLIILSKAEKYKEELETLIAEKQ